MTLLLALIGGKACGLFISPRRRALIVWFGLWAVVLPLQTLLLVDPDNRDDWSYWPVQTAIVAIAVMLVHLGARLRAARQHRAAVRERQG